MRAPAQGRSGARRRRAGRRPAGPRPGRSRAGAAARLPLQRAPEGGQARSRPEHPQSSAGGRCLRDRAAGVAHGERARLEDVRARTGSPDRTAGRARPGGARGAAGSPWPAPRTPRAAPSSTRDRPRDRPEAGSAGARPGLRSRRAGTRSGRPAPPPPPAAARSLRDATSEEDEAQRAGGRRVWLGGPGVGCAAHGRTTLASGRRRDEGDEGGRCRALERDGSGRPGSAAAGGGMGRPGPALRSVRRTGRSRTG